MLFNLFAATPALVRNFNTTVENSWCCHLTDYLTAAQRPDGTGGLKILARGVDSLGQPIPRTLVHFSLNIPADAPTGALQGFQMKYLILFPFFHIKDLIAGFDPEDVTIRGNVDVPKGTIVISRHPLDLNNYPRDIIFIHGNAPKNSFFELLKQSPLKDQKELSTFYSAIRPFQPLMPQSSLISPYPRPKYIAHPCALGEPSASIREELCPKILRLMTNFWQCPSFCYSLVKAICREFFSSNPLFQTQLLSVIKQSDIITAFRLWDSFERPREMDIKAFQDLILILSNLIHWSEEKIYELINATEDYATQCTIMAIHLETNIKRFQKRLALRQNFNLSDDQRDTAITEYLVGKWQKALTKEELEKEVKSNKNALSILKKTDYNKSLREIWENTISPAID